jgi:hypothetical protein
MPGSSEVFEVISVKDGLMGGHYAVVHGPTGRVIGRSFRLDRTQADVLKWELDHVRELAKREMSDD